MTTEDTGQPDLSVTHFNQIGQGALPGLLGIEVLEVGPGRLRARLEVRPEHHAPNGYLHAATVVALADTACGYGCVASWPEGVTGFTTAELKANFLRSVLRGGVACDAELVHGGRTTQVWDARVTAEDDGKPLALFRCTQILLRAP